MSKQVWERSLEVYWGHQIETKPIDWLWQPWLARGVIAVVDGDPGVGKSSLTMDLVARITTGRPFPTAAPESPHAESAGPESLAPRCCIIVAMEDPVDKVVVPRLQAAGADLSKVAILGGVKETGPAHENVALLQLPRDLELIGTKCRELRPAMLVIDPLFAVLGYDEGGRYIKASDDQSVRRLTSRLKRLAEELGITIVLVRHLTKALGGSAIKRGSGSIAFGAQARAVLLVARDPNDLVNGRILAMTKTNFASLPRSLVFQVVGAGGSSRVEWLGDSDLMSDDIAQAKLYEEVRKTACESAKYFLRTTLYPSGDYTWEMLVELAKKEGISERTLRNARTELGLLKRWAAKNQCFWRLPPMEELKMHC